MASHKLAWPPMNLPDAIAQLELAREDRRRLENQARGLRAKNKELEAKAAELRAEMELLQRENKDVWSIHDDDMARACELEAEIGVLRAKLLSVAPYDQAPAAAGNSNANGAPAVVAVAPTMSIDEAAATGNLAVLREWVKVKGKLKYTAAALDKASENGHLDVLKWWHAQRDPRLEMLYTANAVDEASARGDNATLSWWKSAYGTDMKCTDDALNWAVSKGHVKTVKWWLYTSGISLGLTVDAVEDATKNDDTAMLDLLDGAFDLDDSMPANPIVLAARNDAIEAAYWWINYPDTPISKNALHTISLVGHTDILSEVIDEVGFHYFDTNLVKRNMHQYYLDTQNWWEDLCWL
ncbi:hypothetical protein H9P43_009079 [Blastocladiella emersonii ATCC 22665]|nr:hypothetical protein H9P43_009079 [Blastocladiella emersonii ATCC 22665]